MCGYIVCMKNRTFGFRALIIVSGILTIMYLLGQTMAIIDYSFTVSTGLQEPAEEITEVGVAFNKGFGWADTLIYIPLLITGIIGLLQKKIFGWYCMAAAMAITIYWPIVILTTLFYARSIPEFSFSDYVSYTILLTLIVVFGVWGLYYLFTRRKILIEHF